MSSLKPLLLIVSALLLSACQTWTNQKTLYQSLGEQAGIELIAERFIKRIIKDPRTEADFLDTNLDRLFEKLSEQLCEISDGPCRYTGDDMKSVHQGMNITEKEFNIGVEIMQLALDDAGVPLPAQNQLLARLAKLRSEIIYQ